MRSFLVPCVATLMQLACGNNQQAEGPIERAGKNVDKAAHKTGEALQGAAQKTGEAADKAAKATGSAVEKAGQKLQGDDAAEGEPGKSQ